MTGVFARQCAELAKDLGVPSINSWSKIQETEGSQKKFLSDGLHLTPQGNAVVYKEVVRVFNKAGLSSEEMPYDFPPNSQIDGKNPEKLSNSHAQPQQIAVSNGFDFFTFPLFFYLNTDLDSLIVFPRPSCQFCTTHTQ